MMACSNKYAYRSISTVCSESLWIHTLEATSRDIGGHCWFVVYCSNNSCELTLTLLLFFTDIILNKLDFRGVQISTRFWRCMKAPEPKSSLCQEHLDRAELAQNDQRSICVMCAYHQYK